MSAFKKAALSGNKGLPYLIFVLLSIPFLGVGGYQTYNELKLMANGETVDAVVVDREFTPRARHDSTYFVVYEFKTGSGITIKDKSQVSRDTYNTLEKGMDIPILYYPENPSLSRTISDNYFVSALVLFLCGSVFFAGATIMLGLAVGREKTKEYLASNGVSIKAKVTDFDEHSSKNGKFYYVVSYAFKSPVDGKELTGKSSPIHEDKLEKYDMKGKLEEITILYNPDNVKQHCWADEDKVLRG